MYFGYVGELSGSSYHGLSDMGTNPVVTGFRRSRAKWKNKLSDLGRFDRGPTVPQTPHRSRDAFRADRRFLPSRTFGGHGGDAGRRCIRCAESYQHPGCLPCAKHREQHFRTDTKVPASVPEEEYLGAHVRPDERWEGTAV